MFCIEPFVGKRFGTWAKSSARFATKDEAQSEIAGLKAAEKRADASSFTRRVTAI